MTERPTSRIATRAFAGAIIAAGLTLMVTMTALAVTGRESAKARRTGSAFIAKGEIAAALRPGSIESVDVSLANRSSGPIWIKSLRMSVSIDAAHAAAGCSATRDFRIEQIPANAFPLSLKRAGKLNAKRARGRRRAAARIRWYSIRARRAKGFPSIEMVNLGDVNQDACKGATLNLIFTGKATNKRPIGMKARA